MASNDELRAAIVRASGETTFEGNDLQREAQRRTITRLGAEYLTEEICGVIEARQVTTLEEYLEATRPGRGFGLNAARRTAIWRARDAFVRALTLDEERIEREYVHGGPRPAVRAVETGAAESTLLARFFPAAAREWRLGLGACVALCPTERAGRAVAAELAARGLEAAFMTG